MNKISSYIIFFFILNACCFQKNRTMENPYIDITKEFSPKEFQTIVAFVLKQGDRRFYCNKYNNSPHYKVDTFDVYLDPIHPSINVTNENLSEKVSDYNTIVIHDAQSDLQYYDVVLKDTGVFLDCHNQKDKRLVLKLFLDKYLPKIKDIKEK
ncbi:hypothetical protein [Flavobacterium piscis]|uniref:Lipoprotein n=1 Tax=Flavobacterium piscis TaxID=1114874 RepID=A0ABU1YEU2_9FLAO|nr:hypothetical protein [Flavobacterium piscis]MDR7212066.1 hypothetical protein [Flavobacterium piscis]